jgi:hypothetical protein
MAEKKYALKVDGKTKVDGGLMVRSTALVPAALFSATVYWGEDYATACGESLQITNCIGDSQTFCNSNTFHSEGFTDKGTGYIFISYKGQIKTVNIISGENFATFRSDCVACPAPPAPEDADVSGLTLAAGLYKKKYEGYFYDNDDFFNTRLVSSFANEYQTANYRISNVGSSTEQDWYSWGFIPMSQYDATESIALPFPSEGKGIAYFGGFIDNPGTASVNPISVSEEVTSNINDNYYQSQGQNNKSLTIKGYFKPSVSGVYRFRLLSDDASYLWLGTNAFDGNRTMNNYVVALPGIHGPYYQMGQFTMSANLYYPLTVEFGNGPEGEGVLIFEYMPPNSNEYTSDLSGKLFYDTESKGHAIP